MVLKGGGLRYWFFLFIRSDDSFYFNNLAVLQKDEITQVFLTGFLKITGSNGC